MFEGSIGPNKEVKAKYLEVLGWVTAMVKKGFVAGTPDVTLADLSFVSTFATLKVNSRLFVCDWGGVDRLYQEARSILNAKSVSSTAHCWNH